MEQRKYSVQEIDALRRVLRDRYLFGTSYLTANSSFSRTFKDNELQTAVEELVRTHMLAGHIALDILMADGYKPWMI